MKKQKLPNRQLPGFIFYENDVAKHIAHLKPIQKGAYLDMIMYQATFGRFTEKQAMEFLGDSFNACWGSFKYFLQEFNEMYYLDWLDQSLEKKQERSDKNKAAAIKRWKESMQM